MKSIKELFRIGLGPSSSHTMGPHRAAEIFAQRHPDATRTEVTLFGSLAATGRGHLTDKAIESVLPGIKIVWEPRIFPVFHPNGMEFRAYGEEDNLVDTWTVYSVGGGELKEDDAQQADDAEVYDKSKMTEILKYCEWTGKGYWEYVEECEGKEIWDYLSEVWRVMKAAVERGIDTEGVLPGPLHLSRKAPQYYIKATGYRDSLNVPRTSLRLCPCCQ